MGSHSFQTGNSMPTPITRGRSNRWYRKRRRVNADKNIAEWKKKGFTYWRDASPDTRIYCEYGSLGGYKYKEITDALTGEKWLAHVSSRGELHTRTRNRYFYDAEDRRIQMHELPYSEAQYDTIRVCVWLMYHGYKPKEIYELLKHPSIGWTHGPGQTPLSGRKIHTWKETHRSFLARGLLWP